MTSLLSPSAILRRWKKTLRQSPKLVQNIHKHGYKLQFIKAPPLSNRPLPHPQGRHDDDHLDKLEEKWGELVAAGIANIITDNSPGFYSPSFLIPKKNKHEHRLTSDLRNLNKYTFHRHIKVPGLESILPLLNRGDWLIKADVRNGYFNVPVFSGHRKYLRFHVRGTTYELAYLPMGLAPSMTAFRAWLQPYMEVIRSFYPEHTTFTYVDDYLGILRNVRHPEATHIATNIRHIFQVLGLPLKKGKENFKPARKVEFLGFIVDAYKLTLSVPPKKSREVAKQIRKTISRDNDNRLRLRHLATCVGKIIALLPACPAGRLHSRHLFDIQAAVVRKNGWHGNVLLKLSLQHRSELHWWLQYINARRFAPLQARCKTHELSLLATDASDRAIAGVLTSDSDLPSYYRRLSRKEMQQHSINFKELLAVYESIIHFRFNECLVNVRCDNTCVVHSINKWGSRSHKLNALLIRLVDHCDRHNIVLTATYIASHSNVHADRLSRGTEITTDTKAESRELRQGTSDTNNRVRWRLSTKHRRFTCRQFRKKPRHELNLHDQPVFTGTLAHQQSSTLLIPPLHRIEASLRAVEYSKTTTLAIVPNWASAPWYNKVAQLAVSSPVLLPPHALQPTRQKRTSVGSWHWIGLLTSGNKRVRTAYRRQRCTAGTLPHLRPCTIGPGNNSESSCSKQMEYLRRFHQSSMKAKC